MLHLSLLFKFHRFFKAFSSFFHIWGLLWKYINAKFAERKEDMDEKEKNLNENSENESTPKREAEDTLHTPESAQPVQETPIVEGVTPEGEKFAGATEDAAEASSTNAFLKKQVIKNQNLLDRLQGQDALVQLVAGQSHLIE